MEITLFNTLKRSFTNFKGKINTALSAKVAVSDIVDNVTSTATDKPLSANMGKELHEKIENLETRGRFLSLWNCPTGLPETDPITNEEYTYQTGDYFIVKSVATGGYTHTISISGTTTALNGEQGTYNVSFSFVNQTGTAYTDPSDVAQELGEEGVTATGSLVTPSLTYTIVGVIEWQEQGVYVIAMLDESSQKAGLTVTGSTTLTDTVTGSAGTTNYKPTGSSYTPGVASTDVETGTVSIDDIYYYDGSVWKLQINTQRTTSFINIAGQPTDNSNLATALNAKQDALSSAQLDATNSGATAAIISDVVLKSTAQEISSTKTFTGNAKVDFEPQAGTDTEISATSDTYSNSLKLRAGNTTGTTPGATEIDVFYNYNTGRKIVLPSTDNDIELGRDGNRFKNIFVAGYLKDGDTAATSKAISVAEMKNHVDDTDIHVTSSDKTTWSGKQDALTFSTYGSGHALGSGSNIYSLGVATGSGITLTDYGQSVQIGTDTTVLATAASVTTEVNRAQGVESGLQSTITAMGTAINGKQDALTAGRNITIDASTDTIDAFSSNVTENTTTNVFSVAEDVNLGIATGGALSLEGTVSGTASLTNSMTNATSGVYLRNDSSIDFQSQALNKDTEININALTSGPSSNTNVSTINIGSSTSGSGNANINIEAECTGTGDSEIWLSADTITLSGDSSFSSRPTVGTYNVLTTKQLKTSSASTYTLSEHEFYYKNSVTSAITLNVPTTSGVAPEYNGQFTIASGGSIAFSGSSVTWVGDTWTANGTYQFSICNGYGIMIKVA